MEDLKRKGTWKMEQNWNLLNRLFTVLSMQKIVLPEIKRD